MVTRKSPRKSFANHHRKSFVNRVHKSQMQMQIAM
nr:MAG TPA: hypothetical protein [Caudoviricetes sp.]